MSIAMGTMLFSQTFEQSFSIIRSEIDAIRNEIDALKSKPENQLSKDCSRFVLLFAMNQIIELTNEQIVTIAGYKTMNFYATSIKEKNMIDATKDMFAAQKGKAIGTITVLIETINGSTEGEGAFTPIDNFTILNLIPRIQGILELVQKMNTK